MRRTLALIAVALMPAVSHAWGPHSEITMAGVTTLPESCALRHELGPELAKLREHCWMGDMRRSLHRDAQEWFYADDYLLFPPMLTHRDHICPAVKETYEPYFRRALQALRTETPRNAARWIGAILHFTEDTGSPPHAAEIRGDVHSKMENWVDAKAITLGAYVPQLLGTTDDEAVAGFLKRMDGLIEFSKQRAERAKPFALAGDRASTEPIVLESALETARVVADLLFTLGEVASRAEGTAELRGTITSAAVPGWEKLPAKIVVLGTPFSTLADADGRYELRHLPPGEVSVSVLRAGCATATEKATLTSGPTVRDFTLPRDRVAGNLVRGGALDVAWLAADRPEGWYPVNSRIDGPHWESDTIPARAGEKYLLRVAWKPNAQGQVLVRFSSPPGSPKPAADSAPLAPGGSELALTVPPDATQAQVMIFCEGSPAKVCEHVALSAER